MINKEQIDIQLKSTFWSDAALYGLILGVALSLVLSISALVEPNPTAQSQYYTSVATYITMASLLSIFSKIRREKHQNTGYSFSKCLSFILTIMLFTGIIVGTFTYIQIQYISPEYYKQLIDLSSQQIKEMGYAISEEQMAQFNQLPKSPTSIIFSSIISMMFHGGFVGLIISFVFRRRAQQNQID